MSDRYERWLEQRRDVNVADDFAAKVLTRIDERNAMRGQFVAMLLARSVVARVVVCGGALVVGGVPYLLVATLAQLMPF